MVILAALVMLWLAAAGGLAAPLPGLVNSGGSLVLTGAEETPSPLTGGDPLTRGHQPRAKTLAPMGGAGRGLWPQEVDSVIFRRQSRSWPEVYYVRPWSAQRHFRSRTTIASPHLEALIQKYARFYGVEEPLVRAVIRHESGGNTQAVSPKGALGLMQLMPATASLMGVRDPFDPEENLAGGVGYLRRCLERFGYNVPLAVAAYNAGPERVAQYGGVPPFAETQLFVRNVMGSYLGGEGLGSFSRRPVLTMSACHEPHPGKNALILGQGHPGRPSRPKIIEVRFHKLKSSGERE